MIRFHDLQRECSETDIARRFHSTPLAVHWATADGMEHSTVAMDLIAAMNAARSLFSPRTAYTPEKEVWISPLLSPPKSGWPDSGGAR